MCGTATISSAPSARMSGVSKRCRARSGCWSSRRPVEADEGPGQQRHGLPKPRQLQDGSYSYSSSSSSNYNSSSNCSNYNSFSNNSTTSNSCSNSINSINSTNSINSFNSINIINTNNNSSSSSSSSSTNNNLQRKHHPSSERTQASLEVQPPHDRRPSQPRCGLLRQHRNCTLPRYTVVLKRTSLFYPPRLVQMQCRPRRHRAAQ